MNYNSIHPTDTAPLSTSLTEKLPSAYTAPICRTDCPIALSDYSPEMLRKIFLAARPDDFGNYLVSIMDECGLTNEDVAYYCHISSPRVSIYRKNKFDSISRRSLAALCIGLHLTPDLSQGLIERSGISFRKSDPYEGLLYTLIMRCSMYTLDEINEYLREEGLPEIPR